MIEYKNINWYYYHGALLPKVPPHYEVNLSKKEQKELLKISKALFLRYTNEWDRDGGEFWYVIKDKKEDLNGYKSKIKNRLKKGLKNCYVELVNSDFIANNAYNIYKSAFDRYKTTLKPMDEISFRKTILDSNEFDFFGVFYNKKLIAYSQNLIQNNICGYSTTKFHPDFLRYRPSEALFFKMNEYYLNKNNFLYVSDGARSISHETNIQNFLIDKFHFRKAYCRLNIIYRWDIELIVKVLYPFRKVIKTKKNKVFQKIFILLKQEEIRRSF